MGDIYDGAFRTIVNDCRQMVLPFINEAFGERYDGTERITFHPNEHFIDQMDEADRKRITDTNFTVVGKEIRKYHLECESGPYNGKILVRLFEYDAQIALDEGEVGSNAIRVTFPHTAVLCLRDTAHTPDEMRVVIETPGGEVWYWVPIAKMASYTIDELFEKKLYILMPFYIFTYERKFAEYNADEESLSELKAEYRHIIERLNRLVEKGEMSGFDRRTIIELSNDVARELTKRYEALQKEVCELMSGAMIITDVHKAREEGKSEGIRLGREEGREEGRNSLCIEMIRDGLITVSDAARKLCMSEEEVRKMMV